MIIKTNTFYMDSMEEITELKKEIAYKINLGKDIEDRLYYPPTIKVDGLNDNDLIEMIEENKKDVEYLESQLPTSENNSEIEEDLKESEYFASIKKYRGGTL